MYRFLKCFIVLFIFFLWLWVAVIEPVFILKVRNIDIQIDERYENLNNLKIAVVADIHLGSSELDYFRANKIIETTNKLDADIVLLLGDYINASKAMTQVRYSKLSNYFSRLKGKYGVYAIMGNHDVYFDPIGTRKLFKDANIPFLENSNIEVETPNGSFYIAAIADPITQYYDFDLAFEGIPNGASTIFLTHSPHIFNYINKPNAITISGHSHGGQIRLPFIGSLINHTKLPNVDDIQVDGIDGLYRNDVNVLYNSNGLGTSRIPVRLLCPPVIDFITLKTRKL